MATSALLGKTRVFNLLKSSLAGQNVEVTYAGVKMPPREWAFVGGVTYIDTDWAAVGARKREESYDVQVVFSIIVPGGSASDAESLALGYVNTFESALRADPTLGGLAVKGAALRPISFRPTPNGTDGFMCEWEGAVRISGARI